MKQCVVFFSAEGYENSHLSRACSNRHRIIVSRLRKVVLSLQSACCISEATSRPPGTSLALLITAISLSWHMRLLIFT